MTFSKILFTALISTFSLVTFAQRVGDIQSSQRKSIARGYESGLINNYEHRYLINQQKEIKRQIARSYENDDRISRTEFQRIKIKQDRARIDISKARRNRRTADFRRKVYTDNRRYYSDRRANYRTDDYDRRFQRNRTYCP